MNKGVREAIYRLQSAIECAEDVSRDTAEMDAYIDLWTTILNATAKCTSDLGKRKTAPGVGSTGSGSKGDHPKTNDSLTHNQSLDEKSPDVKTGETYILARHSGNGMGHFESAGEATGLAVCCAATISGLAERLPKPFVIAAILSGCDHAGITMYELVATHEGAHIR